MKDFPNAEEALKWAIKQEWSRLKKGFVLVNPFADAGQPSMHRYIGGGYTGALMIAGCNGKVATNQHQDADTHGAATDVLLLVSESADVTQRWRPSKTDLAWSAASTTSDQFLIQFDSGIHLWSADGTPPQRISEPTIMSSPFLAASNGHASWHSGEQITVMRLADRESILQFARKPTLVGGHSRQMVCALSPDAATLSCCSRPGEIEFINVAQAETVRRHQGDFEMITKMAWSADGCWLLALEQYGRWRLMCMDTATGESRQGWPEFIDMTRTDFALDSNSRRLAVIHRGHVALYDFADMREIQRFPVDHLVRTAHIAWTGENNISVRTDYGCLSTYVV
ncbi:WD40 repeat domain-containing protein [Stenotrophomonas maltophilia]|uniref:WD40 repeat domain-containing protein n=1 Tax=Stenotrophomonas maltophilia TaxID=40324 RepID=UPI00117C007F|nr:WD40 repeat domain-containing protein [Stenotrophomonas maltophilia]NYB76858.1 WD40 repeat domain-containing protein [Stenotrophomonas maltophilia]